MPYFGILGEEAYHVNKHIEYTRGEKKRRAKNNILYGWIKNGERMNQIIDPFFCSDLKIIYLYP
jgi:hypothetical protein